MQIPELKDCTTSVLEGLACVLSERNVAHSEVIVYQGAEVEDLYFVIKGGVKVRCMYDQLLELYSPSCALQVSATAGDMAKLGACAT